ncbi:MAG: acyltransferase family protein [Pseudomonadota bacterium]
MTTSLPPNAPQRMLWVDASKGICILLVVMFHATSHVSREMGAGGVFEAITRFSAPFRMPDFFLISGLFLARRIAAPLSVYLDRKVLHFFYFYWIWIAITFFVLTPGLSQGQDVFLRNLSVALVYPWGPLWFIYFLPICFVVTRALAALPRVLVFAGALLAHAFHVEGEPLILVYFTHYYVFFFTGFWAAPLIFKMADRVAASSLPVLAVVGVWTLVNGWLVFTGYADDLPGLTYLLGLAGGLVLASISAIIQHTRVGALLAALGNRSLVVFLAFFIPLRIAEQVFMSVDLLPKDIVIALSIAVGVAAPLILFWIIQRIGFGSFLFERPAWARLGGQHKSHVPYRS